MPSVSASAKDWERHVRCNLRFSWYMCRDRRFVLSYFMADDTISIFEPPVKNTGIVGGRYLERRPVHRPNSQATYTEQDLFAGAKIVVHARTFELLEADEFTMQASLLEPC